MAKTNPVHLCPRCQAELPPITPETCPTCRFVLRAQDNSVFDSPDYLHHQYGDTLRENTEGVKDTKKKADVERRLGVSLESWSRTCPDSDRIAAMMDAMTVLASLLQSNASVDVIRSVTKVGKRIGEISAAIDNYASKGGKFNVATPLPPTAGSPGGPEDIESP